MLELEEAIEMSKARGKMLTEFSKVNVEQTQVGTYQSECRDSAQFGQLNPKSDPGPIPELHPRSDPGPIPELNPRSDPDPIPELNPKSDPGPIPELNPRSDRGPIPEPNARQDIAGLLRLPVVEVKKFGGEVTEIAHFMISFSLKIESKVPDAKEKLYYQEQHMVEGSKPHHIVASCL